MTATPEGSPTRRRWPDFFIVGAPKCGTTALSEYLREHPEVYIPARKEPHFFATDLHSPRWSYVTDEDDYLDMFTTAPEATRRVGEGSVFYLYSQVALGRLLDAVPAASLIAIVRHPLDLAYSFHQQLLRNGFEDRADFRTAWELQERRRSGRDVPSTCFIPSLLQYREVASVGSQLSRLVEAVPADQRLLLRYDDLASGPETTMAAVETFLGVAASGRTDYAAVNVSTGLRSHGLGRVVTHVRRSTLVERVGRRARGHRLGAGLRSVYKRSLDTTTRLNRGRARRPPLDPAFLERLDAELASERVTAEQLVGGELRLRTPASSRD